MRRSPTPYAALLGGVLALWPSVVRAESPLHGIDTKAAAEVAIYEDTNAVEVVTTRSAPPSATRWWDGRREEAISSTSSRPPRSTSSRARAAPGTRSGMRARSARGTSRRRSASRRPGLSRASRTTSRPREACLLRINLQQKMVVPTLGYAYGHETAGRTGTPFSVYSLELQRHTVNGGVELVVDAMTTLSLAATAILKKGDQSKPYRYLPLFSPEVASTIQPGASFAVVSEARLPGRISERLPDVRRRAALSARLARRLAPSHVHRERAALCRRLGPRGFDHRPPLALRCH